MMQLVYKTILLELATGTLSFVMLLLSLKVDCTCCIYFAILQEH